MKYIVYLTINLVNYKIYIGVHRTDNPYKFDGYLGNGLKINDAYLRNYPKEPFHYAVKKHGIANFIRKTIAVFDTRKEAEDLKKILVNEEFIRRGDTYNATIGGGTPPTYKKTIYQYTLDGVFIKEWNSIIEAALNLKTSNSSIGKAILDRTPSIGFLWAEYKCERLNLDQFRLDENKCRTFLFDLEGNLAGEFKSISDCARYLETTPSQILNCIQLKSCFHSTYYISDSDQFTIPVRNSHRNCPIYQYDKNGNFIQEWENETSINKFFEKNANISNAIKQGRCAQGYQWSYTKVPYMKRLENKSGRIRKVGKYDLNGNLIQVFDSVRLAKEDTGGSTNALYGRQKTSGGYIWKFIEE